MDKYFNDFQDANDNIIVGISKYGRLNRLYYPNRDFYNFIDDFKIGFKINNSQMIFLSDDINNVYKSYYEKDSNIIKIYTTNTYFNITFIQTYFVSDDTNSLVCKLDVINLSDLDYDLKLYINSKIPTDSNNIASSIITENGIIQYNHDYSFSIISNKNIESHRLNDVDQNIKDCNIYDKDICGMSENVCICYNLETIKKRQENGKLSFSFLLIPRVKQLLKNIRHELEKLSDYDVDKLIKKRLVKDKKFLEKHDMLKIDLQKCEKNLLSEIKKDKQKTNEEIQNELSWKLDYITRIYNIYVRSLFVLKNLQDPKTGAIVASLEVDENRSKSGMYNFVWPRDSVFISSALDIIGLEDKVDKFYNIFLKNAQNDDGSFEQRYYCNSTPAPCWGYQIDETASIVFGILNHYYVTNDIKFLQNNLQMVEKAVDFVKKYLDDTYNHLILKSKRQMPLSYDLWEMHEGYSIYSISSIIACLNSYSSIISEILSDNNQIEQILKDIKKYKKKAKEVLKLFIENDSYYVRNLEDKNMDISILSLVYPFGIEKPNEKLIKNTIDKINFELRTYTNGYKRFVGDSYLNGIPWPICNMFLANYYLKTKDFENAKKVFDFVIYSCSKNYMLSEQVDNSQMEPIWVIGLGWSHAMFVITLNEMIKNKVIKW